VSHWGGPSWYHGVLSFGVVSGGTGFPRSEELVPTAGVATQLVPHVKKSNLPNGDWKVDPYGTVSEPHGR